MRGEDPIECVDCEPMVEAFAERGCDCVLVDAVDRLEAARVRRDSVIGERLAARVHKHENTIRVAPHLPAALVYETVMERAQQHAVLSVCGAVRDVVHEMVDMEKAVVRTAREPASRLVASFERAAQRPSDGARSPSDDVRVALPHVEPHAGIA